MSWRLWLRTSYVLVISVAAAAQVLTIGGINSSSSMSNLPMGGVDVSVMGINDELFNGINHSPLENPNVALSKLDLKAPPKAQHEYNRGYQLLMKKSLGDAVQHLSLATSIYPSYVAAHNALGSAYMGLGQSDQARTEFSQAAALDDHLPNSYLNLGCAELALKNYAAAETDIEKASAMAPLDLQLLTALAYSQYMNHNYPAAVATAHQVHERKHARAAMVHFYAAAALEAQGDNPQAQAELGWLLKEDPKSPAADSARQMMAQLRDEALHPPVPVATTSTYTVTFNVPIQIPQDADDLGQAKAQKAKELAELAEAEAECPNCIVSETDASELAGALGPSVTPKRSTGASGEITFRTASEEVALFFSATDGGRSVADLSAKNVTVLDNHKAPAMVTGFRNEDQLPLRLGLVIDTSDSIKRRFKFEQSAANEFLTNVVTHPEDLAFVVGFANSVLLVQDFTSDPKLITHGVDQLVPAGGTALWDAIAFAADKLRSRTETQAVARVLVVISDGEDNSSSATAKQAINRAQRGEVTVYTISTRELIDSADDSVVGEHALRALAELTGGDIFTPGSARSLDGSLRDLQQVIRSRYLISYKPASFERDGTYRTIDIAVQKDGRKLRVLSRKGYIASPNTAADPY